VRDDVRAHRPRLAVFSVRPGAIDRVLYNVDRRTSRSTRRIPAAISQHVQVLGFGRDSQSDAPRRRNREAFLALTAAAAGESARSGLQTTVARYAPGEATAGIGGVVHGQPQVRPQNGRGPREGA
jgi:hypothetical protein